MRRRELLIAAAGLGLVGRAARAAGRARDVVYWEPDGRRLLMDIYRPEGTGPFPAVVLIHGGGWIQGSKAAYETMGPRLALHGFVACAINYRLAPDYPYPAAMDDCHRAVRWVRANASAWDVDPRRVAAMGDSAGGHLAALIGVRDPRKGVDRELADFRGRPDAVVANYGAHELVRMWDIEMAHRPLTAWLGGEPKGRERRYAEASPAGMVDDRTPPFLIVHGSKDAVNPLEQSELLHEALRAKGRPSRLLVIEGAGHGWPLDSDFGRRAEAATVQFLREALSASDRRQPGPGAHRRRTARIGGPRVVCSGEEACP